MHENTLKGVPNMVEKDIMLTDLESVKKFVQISNDQDFDVDVSCGKYIVNAKSLMGIFSLDLTQVLHITAYCDASHEFVKQLTPYIYSAD